MVYENAYANCPGTRWAFQSLHTGVPTIQIDGLGIPAEIEPLASRFKELGYCTGGFAVNGFVSREYGYDTGFDTFYSVGDIVSKTDRWVKDLGKWVNETLDNEFVRDRILFPVYNHLWSSDGDDERQFMPDHSDVDTVDHALRFITQHRDESYLLWVHLMDAHTPYGHRPEHLRELRGDATIDHTIHPGRESRITVGDEPPANVVDTYDAGIRSADEQIGRLLAAIPDDATVVITGDHGEEFGRYNGFHHASLYSSMTQVPILVRDDDIGTGRSEMPVQHLDIPPTLLQAASRSLPEIWTGEPLQLADRDVDTPLFFSLGEDQVAVRTGDWKYLQVDGSGELYHTAHGESDGEPVTNPDRERAMANLVAEYLERSTRRGQGRAALEDDDLDQTVEANLEDLGYL
jgi:arylsulfatase A-like enzyme